MDHLEHLLIFVLSGKVTRRQKFFCVFHTLEYYGWKKFFKGEGEEYQRIDKKKNDKDDYKKECSEDRRLSIKRVAKQVKNDEKSGRDVTEKKKSVEDAKDKSHDIFLQ